MESITIKQWQVIAQTNELVNPNTGSRIALAPHLTELLLFFIESEGEALTQQDIASVVWPGEQVTNQVINDSVTALKLILAQDSQPIADIKLIDNGSFVFKLAESAEPIPTNHDMKAKQDKPTNRVSEDTDKKLSDKVVILLGIIFVALTIVIINR